MGVRQQAGAADQMPWLVFKLCGQMYALSSSVVNSIFRLEHDIVPMPDSQENVRGVIHLRGEVITAIDLRSMMGLESFEEQHQQFSEMLDQRKQDHINWINELQRCVEEHETFTLTTDPHQCAFGKWYDSFETSDQSVRFHMRKIEEPHRKVHEIAINIFKDCEGDCDKPEKKAEIEELLHSEKAQYMPKILELLEETKEVFKEGYKEMCIVISDRDSDSQIGLLVDEVVAVESLNFIGDNRELLGLEDKNLIVKIAQSPNISGEIFILDSSIIFENTKCYGES